MCSGVYRPHLRLNSILLSDSTEYVKEMLHIKSFSHCCGINPVYPGLRDAGIGTEGRPVGEDGDIARELQA